MGPEEDAELIHTQEVRGSSPCAPTIYSFRINLPSFPKA
jgi:hypothetical protein